MNKTIAQTATYLRQKIAAGEISSEALVAQYLARVQESEPAVQAWAYLDTDGVLQQARARDAEAAEGRRLGILHGLPVGIKDIIYTNDMPTQHNSKVYEGHWPRLDAACVTLLRAAGAVILGKTTTAEFASMGALAPTSNPHDLNRTPGGSSSGSAAAIAADMVPLALGTQTGGSTIRPAAFCGVYGMKPTYGLASLAGVRPYAPSLDTLGIMGRSVADLDLLCRALRITTEGAEVAKPQNLRIGIFRSPAWEEASADVQVALGAAGSALAEAGVIVEEVGHIPGFSRITEAQNLVMHGEGQRVFQAEYQDPNLRVRMHSKTVDEALNVLNISADQLRWAYDYLAKLRSEVDEQLAKYDAWITPSAPGEAPFKGDGDGSAIFNRCWTALHTSCITLPAYKGSNGMPVGLQLVGRRFSDLQLLGTAACCSELLGLPKESFLKD